MLKFEICRRCCEDHYQKYTTKQLWRPKSAAYITWVNAEDYWVKGESLLFMCPALNLHTNSCDPPHESCTYLLQQLGFGDNNENSDAKA